MNAKIKIDFKYVDENLEKNTKDFIIKECKKYYKDLVSVDRAKVLYENMGKLLKNKEDNAFYVAINEQKKIIGAISISLYDNRIETIKEHYENKKVAEVGRCYILEEYRRQGIASNLLNLVNSFAKEKEYEKMYLHTHYFLPGGFEFWSKVGFKIVYDEKDEMQTVHMQKDLR